MMIRKPKPIHPEWVQAQTSLAKTDPVLKGDPRQPGWKQQRQMYGWDNTELWNLDITLAKLILPRLRRFRVKLQGWPASLTLGEWQDALDKMIKAFELILDEDYHSWDDNGDMMQTVETGLTLFAKYYRDLWQ